MTTTDTLIRELSEKVGLEAVDAHRSAFTALACSTGWTKARVGRWLGITRARVGQKVDKLLYYATTRDDVPTLTRLMTQAMNLTAQRTAYDTATIYTQEQWRDLDFARRLIDSVDDGTRS